MGCNGRRQYGARDRNWPTCPKLLCGRSNAALADAGQRISGRGLQLELEFPVDPRREFDLARIEEGWRQRVRVVEELRPVASILPVCLTMGLVDATAGNVQSR